MTELRDLLAAALADPPKCEHPGGESCDQWHRADAAIAAMTPEWWVVPKIAHDEERAVTPIVRESWIYRDAGTSSAAHTRFFAAQLLAAADELEARLAAVTPPSEGTQK